MNINLNLIGQCRACRAVIRVVAVPAPEHGARRFAVLGRPSLIHRGRLFAGLACRCGAPALVQMRAIHRSPKAGAKKDVCNGSCRGGRGPVCNCECGGDNHGAGHAMMVQA